MAEDSIKCGLRPAWKLAISIAWGLALIGVVLAWPAVVRGVSAPVITHVELTSSKPTFFYSPLLADSGGTVYFNNLSGEGAGQVVTVTVTVSDADDNSSTFSGGYAFGTSPTTNISTSYGTTSIWSVSYTISASDFSQNGVVFTITDESSLTDTLTITFIQDITGPGFVFNFVRDADADSGNDGFAPDVGWEDDLTANFTWEASIDSGGSGIAGYHLSSSSPVTTAFNAGTSGSLKLIEDGAYNFFIRAKDKVGNLGSPTLVMGAPPFQFDRDAPANGRLDIYEESGGKYLYIADESDITTGTLFYNNLAASSFTVHADDTGAFHWGAGSVPWKVVFSPGWGESGVHEVLYPASEYVRTYSISPSDPATEVFTVSYVNKAGNVLSIPIDAEPDVSGPVFAFTSLTPPDFEDNGDNWYRTGGLASGWTFTTDVASEQAGVAPGVGRAYWDHIDGALYDQAIAAPGGDGTFTGVSSNPDGTVAVTVVLTDRVNNPSSISTPFYLDGTPPVVTPSGWSESSNFLHIIGDELFFSHMMAGGQPATLSGTAADNPGGSGLQRAAFSDEANLAGSPDDDFSPAGWSGSYTFASNSTQGDGLAVVTIYDQVRNTVTHNAIYVEDVTPPVVTYTGVTAPGYDPDGDPLNDTGNWYAASNFDEGPGSDDWVFFFDFSDSQTGPRSASADWDHSNDADDQIGYNPGLDGVGVFGTGGGSSGKSVRDDADGTVTVTVRVEDNVGNVGSDSLTLRIDNTLPSITSGGWSESSEFLHADGATLYFSHQMASAQQATLAGDADDGVGSGLNRMSFSNEPNLFSSPVPDDTPANWAGEYGFASSSLQGDGTVIVTLDDHLGHQKTQAYTYVLDIDAPTVPDNFEITTPPHITGYYKTQVLGLSWDPSNDNVGGSGLLGYYLDTTNSPHGFQPPSVTATSYDVGSDGVFTFYLQAMDNVGNGSLTSIGPITVDTQGPTSSITASPEEPERRFLVQWEADDAITWPVDYDVQYRVDGGAWTPWLSGTSSTSKYFGPNAPVVVDPTTFFEFRARARDYLGNLGGWSTPWGGSVTRRFIYLPSVFTNLDPSIPYAVFDGFETGQFVGWKKGGSLSSSVVSHPVTPLAGTPPNGGDYAARLGSPSYGCYSVPVGRAFIKAYAYVPSSGTPYLRFDYRVLSYDTVRSEKGEWWDRLEVQVNGAALARYGDPDTLYGCTDLYDTGWSQAEFDLSAYAGQVVTLTFFNENHYDSESNTYSYLDNIRIETGP